MATTTNFGWETPDDTDLVKDGALAMRTLGNAIDTSLVDLKGGTTGQVLSKTSNTDMDFTWVTSDDANAIQNAIVDAKGDLIAATANDTPARLAVGNNGETLVADSSTSTGLRWQGNFAAGKNKIINGDFGIWQRGTSITFADGVFTSDRWYTEINSGTAGTGTVSRQAFTPGTAPVAGYEGNYFLRYNLTSAGTSTTHYIGQRIEDVTTFAGQTVTLSFWAKANSARTVTSEFIQRFGSGGSGAVTTSGASHSVTTSWTRFSVTVAIPSISGKTIGTGSNLNPRLNWSAASGATIDIWGVQLEAGNVATAFQTATGTLAGELAACQRYYVRWSGDTLAFCNATYYQTTNAYGVLHLPVEMRTAPTGTASGTTALNVFAVSASLTSSAIAFAVISNKTARIQATTTASTLGAGAWMTINGATAFIEMSAEL